MTVVVDEPEFDGKVNINLILAFSLRSFASEKIGKSLKLVQSVYTIKC